MKNRFTVLVALLLSLLVISGSASAEAATYRIGICQLVQHAALEEATQGFTDAVKQQLGDRVELNVQNASGDSATCISVVNTLLAEEVDLILANSTQALQAASAATADVPILGVSVTDYPAALDLDEWDGMTHTNVSGTSDLAPLDAQAELIHTMFPDAKEVGILYCSSEVNSLYQIKLIREYLEPLGYACEDYAFTDTNDVFMVAQNACQNNDVIFVPTDNTIASCTELILNVVEVEKVPVIGGDKGICSGCGVATVCVDYYDLGYTTGLMACDILTGKSDISQMPIEFSPVIHTVVNPAMCDALGIAILDGGELLTR